MHVIPSPCCAAGAVPWLFVRPALMLSGPPLPASVSLFLLPLLQDRAVLPQPVSPGICLPPSAGRARHFLDWQPVCRAWQPPSKSGKARPRLPVAGAAPGGLDPGGPCRGCSRALFFFFNFIYLFMRKREREAETQAEGEAGSMQGARRGTRFRDPGITP